jgi:signal transduction histidine kinase
MELSGSRLLTIASIDPGRLLRAAPATRADQIDRPLQERYARQTATTVSAALPWAAATFIATYAAVAVFELQLYPDRLGIYVSVMLLGALECALGVALTRSSTLSPARCLAITTVLGVMLIFNTTLYHVLAGGEAEVLALGNLYLMIGFLAAIPWGGWPQLTVALAACGGLIVGLLTTVDASVSSGILLSGMASLGGLSVAAAVLTDRYRYSFFLAQEQLQAAKDAAEKASHARRDFVATVSHDLRTPVNIIYGMADMALDVAVTAEQRELVETIKRSAGQLNALLNDLLDFSKIDAGVVDLAPRRFAVRSWLQTVLEPHLRDAEAKRLRLIAAVDPAVPEAVVSDPDRLQQVLANLVANAVKFTDAGEIAVRLKLCNGADRSVALRCEVRDTGIGIAPEESARVFEPFAQSAATSRSHGGSGLGLAICRRLAEQMGGTIGVESAVGRGSTFWFTVPLA